MLKFVYSRFVKRALFCFIVLWFLIFTLNVEQAGEVTDHNPDNTDKANQERVKEMAKHVWKGKLNNNP